MSKKATVILPQMQRMLNQMGEQIRLARLRRRLTAELVAERAGISRMTLCNIEKAVRRLQSAAMQRCCTR